MKRVWILIAVCCISRGVMAAPPDGYVVRVDSATVYLDWGTVSGAQAGDRFELYRQGAPLKHPVTGAVLGQAEEKIGAGTLQTVEAKFAIGHLDSLRGAPLAGDRSRWLAIATPPPAVQEPVVSSGAVFAELWRSEPLDKNAVGITFADLDGDGQKDIIVAYRKKIIAYRFKDKKLETLAAFDSKAYRRWLTVDTADLKQDGHEEVFASAFLEGVNRPQVVVLRFENGSFREMAAFEGFVRSIPRADGKRHLYWQNLSHSRNYDISGVSELLWEKNSYRPGPSLGLKLFDDQLFGFVWGDWTKSGNENIAVLEHGERIRMIAPDVKWKSSEVYGGTKNDFSLEEKNVVGSLFPRLVGWRPSQADRDTLIVPTNLPDMGVRMTYLKLYRKSQIDGIVWNGLEMKSMWRIPLTGYLADFGVLDLLGQSRPQVWAAVVGPGDKTVLLSYSLP